MRKTIFCILAGMLALQGCTALMVHSIRKEDVIGKDIDEMRETLTAKGFECLPEFRDRISGKSPEITGGMRCFISDLWLCPNTYRVSFRFYPDTRKIRAFGSFVENKCGY